MRINAKQAERTKSPATKNTRGYYRLRTRLRLAETWLELHKKCPASNAHLDCFLKGKEDNILDYHMLLRVIRQIKKEEGSTNWIWGFGNHKTTRKHDKYETAE